MTAVLGAAGWLLVCLCILAAMWWWDARQERKERRPGYLDDSLYRQIVAEAESITRRAAR